MTKLFYNPGGLKVSKQFVEKIFRVSQRKEKKIKGSVEVNVIGDAEMKKMNFLWRGKKETTDVLSFAWNEEKKFSSGMLGQIFISCPQVKRQAKEAGIGFDQEFARMLVHGLLHLVGYDHAKPKDAKRMFYLQEEIVKKII